tara:strand:+ start:135 stop:494 length:360 start_codon:yes stop_codon:yes gene_type:complete
MSEDELGTLIVSALKNLVTHATNLAGGLEAGAKIVVRITPHIRLTLNHLLHERRENARLTSPEKCGEHIFPEFGCVGVGGSLERFGAEMEGTVDVFGEHLLLRLAPRDHAKSLLNRLQV